MRRGPEVLLGLPKSVGEFPGAAERLGTPVLLSANSFFDHKRKQFRAPGAAIMDLDRALDSAGFVAMSRYGGYPWTVPQYVELAALGSWRWWGQMDYCCEPEVAADRGEVIHRMVRSTYYLKACRQQARVWRDQGIDWLQDPLPILQGWRPEDYARCAEWYDHILEGAWPALVGIGSVCRRSLYGEDGLFAILDTLDDALPLHVHCHLFGVKGAFLRHAQRYPWVVSTDSMAWDFHAMKVTQARRKVRAAELGMTLGDLAKSKHHIPNSNAHRIKEMAKWLKRQTG